MCDLIPIDPGSGRVAPINGRGGLRIGWAHANIPRMGMLHSDSTLSTYTASDGDNLAVQDWPLPQGLRLRGTIIIVHGLGEHAGRYERVARHLNEWGFAVRGYDQYGHGESDGVRGALPAATRLVDDLADLIDSTRIRIGAGVPLIVLGHSMGGLVAATMVAQQLRTIEGLVLSSPLLRPRLSSFQKMLLDLLPRIAPNFTVSNGVDPCLVSRDSAVVQAYRSDPLVHDRVSARLARFIADAGASVVSQAPVWNVPTLLMYSGSDGLVDPAGSRAFAASAPRKLVSAHCFQELYHEIFNEADSQPVFERLREWLDERF